MHARGGDAAVRPAVASAGVIRFFFPSVAPNWPVREMHPGMPQFLGLQVFGVVMRLLWLPRLRQNRSVCAI